MRKRGTNAAILLCWFAYTTSFLGRYSYASNIPSIMAQYGITHSQAGLVTTFLFVSYGIGQLINGIFCRYYSQKWVIAVALVTSALLNIAVFVGVPFAWIKYLWFVNGCANSVFYSLHVRILSQRLKRQEMNRAILALGTTTPMGFFLAYLISSVCTSRNYYIGSFLIGAIMLLTAAVLWVTFFDRVFVMECPILEENNGENRKQGIDRSVLPIVIVLCLLAAAQNSLKDGLTTWVPSIFNEYFGLQDSLSILVTVVLPLMGLVGSTISTLMQKKVPSLLKLLSIWFVFLTFSLFVIKLTIKSLPWTAVVGLFGISSLCMYGVNNIISGMFPFYLRKKIDSGFLAGLLNSFNFVGSTISSGGLGVIADRVGWDGVFVILPLVAVVSAGIAIAMAIFKQGTEGTENA